MSHTYTPDPTQPFPTGYTVPDDGDAETAASILVSVEGEANAISRLALPATTAPNLPELASRSYSYGVEGPFSCDYNGGVATWQLGPGSGSVFGPGSIGFQTDISNVFKVYQILDVPHGSTIKNVICNLQGATGHPGLPSPMPTLGLYKVRLTTGVQSLLASQADTSGSVPTYEAAHQITLGGALNVLVDRTLYYYFATVSGETGGNAVAGLGVWSFAATRQVTTLDAG